MFTFRWELPEWALTGCLWGCRAATSTRSSGQDSRLRCTGSCVCFLVPPAQSYRNQFPFHRSWVSLKKKQHNINKINPKEQIYICGCGPASIKGFETLCCHRYQWWFSEAEVVGQLPAILKAHAHRNTGTSSDGLENTSKHCLVHPNCLQVPSWACYTSRNGVPWTAIGWGLQDQAVCVCTMGKIAFNFWWHLLNGTLSNSCCSAALLSVCMVLCRVCAKLSFWSENFAFLFCLPVACTGWGGEGGREEGPGRNPL